MNIDDDIECGPAPAPTAKPTPPAAKKAPDKKPAAAKPPTTHAVSEKAGDSLTAKTFAIGAFLVFALVAGIWYVQSWRDSGKPATATETASTPDKAPASSDDPCASATDPKDRWYCEKIVALTSEANAARKRLKELEGSEDKIRNFLGTDYLDRQEADRIRLKKLEGDLEKTAMLVWVLLGLIFGNFGAWAYTTYKSKKTSPPSPASTPVEDDKDDEDDEDDEDEGTKPASK